MKYGIAALALAGLLAAAPACAGCVVSADEIRKSLSGLPSEGMGAGCTSRGLRAAAPEAPAPQQPAARAPAAGPAAAKPPAARPTPVANGATPPPAAPHRASAFLPVEFVTGSATLTAEAAHQLDELGHALTSPEFANVRFEIAGHTDTVGNPDANRTLSERRAAAVAQYLESYFNLPAARLVTIGKGSDDPAVPTGPQVNEPRNRRVEIVKLDS